MVGFADVSGTYQFEWHADQPASGLGSATSVAASSGSPATVDATLTSNRGSIAGQVSEDVTDTPLEGIWAFAIDSTGSVVGQAQTGSDGAYHINSVPVGPVRVRFFDVSGAHVPEYWDDHGGTSGSDGYTAATVINVMGRTTAIADAALAPAT